MSDYHLPVFLNESIDALIGDELGGTYVDTTFGGGGHSKLILDRLNDDGRLYAFDQDEDSYSNVIDDPRFTLIQHNFRYIKQFLRLHKVRKVDGILADLGVSSHQFDKAERGFSYRFNADLDMRMNRKETKTAANVVNKYSEAELVTIFSLYGEVRNSKTLAKAIVQERSKNSIKTIQNFLNVIEPNIRGKRMRYLSQVFQAIRIEVNDEMGALEDLMKQSLELFEKEGRLVVISYHSIEDRIVKKFMQYGNVGGEMQKDFYGNIFRPFKILTKKAISPSAEEMAENPKARSAKMRIAIYKDT